ncbi:hypothetical protein [Arthrobacter sulfonylureivorans]|uniref:Two-component sensor histidine kinase n=1 Tax=Arthrobacter sulfonylureivorans TaxID=2486855 RepID=A0ABY3W8K2_9MICC|nr:hypothetical protein [Arthrobacter sulfonylureivorans]UNK46664.1 hypothetical protein MNQ99_04715 [Arthrobacter sulfonylureivorans]
MAHDYDNQLIESVAVRRTRLATALLYGNNPLQRRWKSSVRTFFFSVALAAVIAAVCVGYSFVTNLLEDLRQQQQQRAQSAVVLQISGDFADDDGGGGFRLTLTPHSGAA